VRLLGKLRTVHPQLPLAIGAYNAGSGAIGRWVGGGLSDDLDLFVELVPYDETRNYIKRVLSTQATYAYLYEPASLDELLRLPPRLTR
ncbi:MAG TPA: lytic murein transglycosylase, partial [Labilithrix sp.]